MAEQGRNVIRAPQGSPLRLNFSAGQSWYGGINSETLAIIGNAYPSLAGGLEMCKGYDQLYTGDFENIWDASNTDTANTIDGKRYYGFDLHNETIIIFRSGEKGYGIFKKTDFAGYTGTGFNMRGSAGTYTTSINDYSRDPLRWADKAQTTEIQGWIVHANPSKDPYMSPVDKIRSAFTVGTDSVKGVSEDYYDPGRVLPMVEAGFYSDNTNPKISFHGVPVPIITGQHKELPFGAPFGSGQIVNGDVLANGGGLHFASSLAAAGSWYNNTEIDNDSGCITDETVAPTQRMFIAMENNLDITGPNMHMFVAPHSNDEDDPYDADGDQKLLWAIRSQEGGVNQEYSTTRHISGGTGNIDNTRDGGTATQETAGRKIYYQAPHPVSVDFDSSGNMFISYLIKDGSNYRVVLKQYAKDSSTGEYTEYGCVSVEDFTNILAFGGIKIIVAPPDSSYTSGSLYVCVMYHGNRSGTLDESGIKVYQINLGATWNASNVPTCTLVRNLRTAEAKNISWFSLDVLDEVTVEGNPVLFITAMRLTDDQGLYIFHEDTVNLQNTNYTNVTLDENQMSLLTSSHGWDYNLNKQTPPLIRAFKHKGAVKLGVLAAVTDDSKTKWFGWTGTYDSEKFDNALGEGVVNTDWTPSSAHGVLLDDIDDDSLTDYTSKIANSANNVDSVSVPLYGYHGDMQGRLHLNEPFYNRFDIAKDASETNNDNYVRRVSYNFEDGTFDAWNPDYGADDEGVNKEEYSIQTGCRQGVLGDNNGLIPTKLGAFLNNPSTNANNFNDYTNGKSNSVNGCTTLFPTTWNGNCALMYPAYTKKSGVTLHEDSGPKILDMVIHGTIYGGSEDRGHPYVRNTTEGAGFHVRNTIRPYPSNNLWCGSNMNPLTPIINLPNGEDEENWHPKTDTYKKPILAGLDINMIDRVTTTSGDISPGKYRYKIAFAKSGSNTKYRNTGAEGNVFSHDKFDAFFEVDLTEAKSRKGIKLHFNRPLLEGKTVFTCGADPNTGAGSGRHQAMVKCSMAASGATGLGNRKIGETVAAGQDGWYTHFDYYGPADVLTNPYLCESAASGKGNTASESLKYYWASEDDDSGGTSITGKGVYIDIAGDHGTSISPGDNEGRHWNVGALGSAIPNYGLRITDSAGDGVDMTHADWSWIKASTKTHLSRFLKIGQFSSNDMGGGFMHFGPDQDIKKPYIKYIIIYRTGDISNPGIDKEAYFKIGEVDLVDDVDWSTINDPIVFLDNIDPRHMGSQEANYTHSMMPVDGDNITAMAASGNRLWVAYNDTFTSTANKHKLPSTLLYSGTHWEYLSPLNTVIVDDNAVIHSLKDFNSSLWIFTDRGTYVIPDAQSTPQSQNFRVMKKSDFVIHNHPNDSERFLRIDGKIYVLGMDGLYLHDPNPMSTKNFQHISKEVTDYFKKHRESGMGLYYDKDAQSIICYSKEEVSGDKEIEYVNVENDPNESQRVNTVNLHLPTSSWWSHVDSAVDDIATTGRSWEQVDDIISVVPDPTPPDAEHAYSQRASGKFTYDPINIMLRDRASDSSNKQIEILRFGHVYGPLYPRGGVEEATENDLFFQSGWIGNPGEERVWDNIVIDYMPPIPAEDTHVQFLLNIDTLNPWAKANGEAYEDTDVGNASPITLGAENLVEAGMNYAGAEINTKEITQDVYANIAQGIPMRVMYPIKVKGELVRIRLRMLLRNYDTDIVDAVDKPVLSTDCSPPTLNSIELRTKYIGRDRKK